MGLGLFGTDNVPSPNKYRALFSPAFIGGKKKRTRLGLQDIADKVKLGQNKILAVVKHLGLQDSSDFFKEVKVGKAKFKRYSQNALSKIIAELPKLDIEDVWSKHRPVSKKNG